MPGTGKPSGWPENVTYLSRNVFSKNLSQDDLKSIGSNGRGITQKICPLVKIRKIADADHPAFGQSGLFATTKIKQGSHIIDYLGFVHTGPESDESSDYDIVLEKSRGIAIDGNTMGSEARMVNDYRGIGPKPNVRFDHRTADDGELRIAIFADRQIAKGEELLVNYGKGFWQERRQG